MQSYKSIWDVLFQISCHSASWLYIGVWARFTTPWLKKKWSWHWFWHRKLLCEVLALEKRCASHLIQFSETGWGSWKCFSRETVGWGSHQSSIQKKQRVVDLVSATRPCLFMLLQLSLPRLPDGVHCHSLLTNSKQRQELLREKCLFRSREEEKWEESYMVFVVVFYTKRGQTICST